VDRQKIDADLVFRFVCSLLHRWDVFPFFGIYGTWLYFLASSMFHSSGEKSSPFGFLLTGFALIVSHVRSIASARRRSMTVHTHTHTHTHTNTMMPKFLHSIPCLLTYTAVPLIVQVLLYLFTIWSVDVRCFVRYRRTQSLNVATLVKVVPHAFTGTREVVPLESTVVVSPSYKARSIHNFYSSYTILYLYV